MIQQILLLDIYSEEFKAGNQTDIYITITTAALFIISKSWKQPKFLPIDGQINKICYIHTKELYAALKRNEILIHLQTDKPWRHYAK